MKIIIRFLKDFLLIFLVFSLAFCVSSRSSKFKLQSRQTAYCLNHAVGDFVANPFNCKEFYWCGENGETVPASCPPNMIFNAATKLCDTSDNVQCETSMSTVKPAPVTQTSIATTDSSSSEANHFCLTVKTQQPNSNALVFIANPRSCYQYYMCYHGQALLQECSANLYWNSKIGKCDLPSNVNCIPFSDDANSIQIPTPMNDPAVDTQNQDYVCPLYGQHIFPHMQRCDFFIYCVKGYGILQKCPFFHYFDVESGTCQWRTVALCVKDLNLKFRKKKY